MYMIWTFPVGLNFLQTPTFIPQFFVDLTFHIDVYRKWPFPVDLNFVFGKPFPVELILENFYLVGLLNCLKARCLLYELRTIYVFFLYGQSDLCGCVCVCVCLCVSVCL